MNGFGPSEIKILSLVQAICKRPSMYTPNGTAEEAMLVLQGIFLAVTRLGTNYRQDENKADIEKIVNKYNGRCANCHRIKTTTENGYYRLV